MDQTVILTLDAGTTGVKCAAFTPEGEAVSAWAEAYPTFYPHPGWAQQQPEEQLRAALRAVSHVLEHTHPQSVCALGLSGTMNGCIPIDREGRALYDNIIHSDLRAEPETESIRQRMDLSEYYGITGNRIDVHSGLPKYLWLQKYEPDVYRKAWKFVNIKDYIYGRLTGCPGRTDYSDASLCNCLDITKGDWAWGILSELGVDQEKMPELHASRDVSGHLIREFAEITGLPEGLPIAIGGGDGACAAHGARRHAPGDAYMNIGSSAWVSAMNTFPVIDSKMRLFNYFDLDEKCYNVCGTVQCGSAASNWAIENLIYPGSKVEDCDFNALEELVNTSSAGARGVFYLPTLMGERTPWWTAKASGTLIGFTPFHNTGDIARAVYEGVMQSLHMCGDILRENGVEIKSMMLIGGGAKSNLWQHMAADMFNAEVRLHASPREATSLGAAVAAGVGIGLYRDFADADKVVRVRSTVQPEAETVQAYKPHFEVFKTLFPNMRAAYEAIADYQAQK